MSYRSLLVHLDQDPSCSTRTRIAVRLAKDLDCHLPGMAATGLVDMPATAGAVASLSEYAAVAWELLRDSARRNADAFLRECGQAGLRSFEAPVVPSDQTAALLRYAPYSDLTVMSQPEPGTTGFRAARERVEDVVLYSARPTLLLPYAGRFDTLGAQVLIAWDDSRESARAIRDALPLLRSAARVHAIHFARGGTAEDETLRWRMAALRDWLQRHGIAADVRVEGTDLPIAPALLSRAADLGADLVVMGAYGHPRWSERLLGGATRGLLDAMTVPVLMSH
jgi:nucleotide-binding universal stress UspA family protein